MYALGVACYFFDIECNRNILLPGQDKNIEIALKITGRKFTDDK